MTSSQTLERHVVLLAYRMRPLQVPGISGAWLLLTAFGVWAVPDTPSSVAQAFDPGLVLVFVSLILGLGAAFMTGSDVDPGEVVLRSLPHEYWRAVAQRLAAWSLPCSMTGCLLAVRAASALALPVRPVLLTALSVVAFSSALSFALARLLGSLIGAGAALAVVGFMSLAPWIWDWFPVSVLEGPGGAEASETRLWLSTIAAALVTLTLAALHRGRPAPAAA